MLISIISLFVAILIILLFFKITHIIWKTILFSILIMIIIIGITGYLIYNDAQKTITEEKLIIISYENKALTGIIFSDNLDDKQYLKMDQLGVYSEYLESGDFESILSDNYLMINVDLINLNEINNTEYMNNTFTKDEIFEMMLAENPKEFINSASKLSDEIELDQGITEDKMVEYKMGISGLLFEDILTSDQDIINKIEIYPERITIKLIKEAPFILNSVKNKFREVN